MRRWCLQPWFGAAVSHHTQLDPSRLPSTHGVRVQRHAQPPRYQAWFPGACPNSHSRAFGPMSREGRTEEEALDEVIAWLWRQVAISSGSSGCC